MKILNQDKKPKLSFEKTQLSNNIKDLNHQKMSVSPYQEQKCVMSAIANEKINS